MKRFNFAKKAFVGIAASVCSIGVYAGAGAWDTTGGTSEMNYTGGNVGIGTSDPAHLLEVKQNVVEPHIVIHNAGGIGGATYRMIDDASGADWKFKAINDGGFKIRDQANSRDTIIIEPQTTAIGRAIYIDSNGNVGIGTTTTTIATALSVAGIIESKELNIKDASTSWPDYVFKEDYKLKSLEEVEIFTKENKHLPGVPSEKEVSANGISIGEITTIQMEKIEELTLYLIDLKKQNQVLSERINALESRM